MTNQAFSFRAGRIYEDVLNAVAQADEIEGLDLDEYARLMMAISDEMSTRAHVAVMRLVEED